MIAGRVAAMVGLFALAAPVHLILKLFGAGRVVPPRFLRGIGWLAGLRVRVMGAPAGGRLLLVGNHTSWLDIFALAGTSGCGFVAKGDLAGHPLLKWLCEQNDTLFVTRERRGGVGSQVAEVRALLERRRMTVFPEGTTGDGNALLPFKSALLAAAEDDAVTVQPVALAYAEPATIAWTGTEPGMANVLRVLARTRPVRLEVRFLEPLSSEEHNGRKAMAQAAEGRIAAALAVPVLSKDSQSA